MSILLYFATLPKVNERRALRTQGLGPLNPYHICYALNSNVLWFSYGFSIDNWFVMIERGVGATLSMYYSISLVGLMAISWSKMNVTFGNADGLQKELLDMDYTRLKTMQLALVGLVDADIIFELIGINLTAPILLSAKFWYLLVPYKLL